MSIQEAHPDPHDLPRQRRGATPQMIGRYPDYDVLSQTGHWDEVTRRVVLDRVENEPPIRFFTPEEAHTLKAFCDVATAQDAEPRIPVLAYIDEKLFKGERDGWQFYDLPDDAELWRRVARGLDEEAVHKSFASFGAAPLEAQVGIVHRFSKAELHAGTWDTVNVGRAFSVVMRYVAQAFYSHPWAWNEIGFGGPAYPRGYAAFGSPDLGEREHWEGDESAHYDPVKDVSSRGLD
ncbi:MAG: gluconate 2-dehydrogenase subunit 3 family protein [Gaiellaceae bacterium]